MSVEIVPATLDHVPLVLAACRERERLEIDRIGYAAFDEDLRSQIGNSAEAWTGFIDGSIACIWCIRRGSILGDDASVWLWTTEEVNRHPFIFVRHSQLRLAELRRRYHHITGFVRVENTVSVRWLGWLGFDLGDTEWLNGHAIRRFTMAA